MDFHTKQKHKSRSEATSSCTKQYKNIFPRYFNHTNPRFFFVQSIVKENSARSWNQEIITQHKNGCNRLGKRTTSYATTTTTHCRGDDETEYCEEKENGKFKINLKSHAIAFGNLALAVIRQNHMSRQELKAKAINEKNAKETGSVHVFGRQHPGIRTSGRV